MENDFEIIVSNTVIEELEIVLLLQEINKFFYPFKRIIARVNAKPEQISEARKEWIKREKELSFNDALHAIIARDNRAMLVTRDRHFFEFLGDIVEIRKPEEIIFD